MSGGHFDYNQHKIGEIADMIERQIADNEYSEHKFYPKTIMRFIDGVKALRIAEVYAQRIDWLLSGDDGEDTFHDRLKADLGEIE